MDVVSNQLNKKYSTGAAAWNTSFGPDSEVFITVVNQGPSVWVFLHVRVSNIDMFWDGDHYMLEVSSAGTWILSSYTVATDYVTIGSGTLTLNNGDSLGLSAVGNQIRAYHKPGAGSWSELVSVADSAVTAAGYIMFRVADSGTKQFDDFGGGTIP